MEPLIFLTLAVAGVGILVVFLLFDLKSKVNKLQVYVEDLEKINQAHLSKQEEKFNEYLREYTNLTIQQLKATQKELEELKDSINKMYKLLTEEITDKDL